MILYDRIVVIDDIQGDLNGLLHSRYRDVGFEQFSRIEPVYDTLRSSSPESTLILLNAHLKILPRNLRCQMKGMTFLRSELRTRWQRREAVVVYSPFSLVEFYAFPHNRIMNASRGHFFFQLPDWKAMFNAIELAKPIETESDLNEIIQRYGSLTALIRTFKHDIENKLMLNSSACYSTATQRTLMQLESLVEDLENLIPERFRLSFQTEQLKKETQHLINNIQRNKKIEIEIHSTQIRSILSSYNELCNQFFKGKKDDSCLVC